MNTLANVDGSTVRISNQEEPADYQWALDNHPEMVLHQAVAAVLRGQQAACRETADPVSIGPDLDVQVMLDGTMSAWEHLKYRNLITDASKSWRVALIVPQWMHAMMRIKVPRFSERLDMNVLQAPEWSQITWRRPEDGDMFAILAVSTLDAEPPSIAVQNYYVNGVFPFRVTF